MSNIARIASVWVALCVMLEAGPVRAQSQGGAPAENPAREPAREPAEGSAGAGHEPDAAGDGADIADVDTQAAGTVPWSEGVPMDRRRQAREMFLQANELALGRFFATAASRYRDAIALWPHPAFHYNLALAQMSLDDPVSAHASLEKALEHGVEPLGRDKHSEARQYRDLLASQLARVAIRCDVPGAQVSLDGTPIFVGPGAYEAVMRPGGYHIEASKPGHIADARQIVLGAGRESRYELVLQREDTERRVATWVPWAVTGAGVAMVAAGGVFHWQASSDFDAYDARFADLCGQGCTRAELADDADRQEFDAIEDGRERARSKRALAGLSYGAGAAAVVTGGLLIYLNRERTVLRRVGGDSADVSLAPVVSPRSVGLQAGFRF
jgi:hypothetical protein